MKDEVTNVLRLANLVRENVRAKQLFTPYNSILVTLSGGQDSICSLLLLYLLQNQLGLEFEVANAAVNKPKVCTDRGLPGTTFRQARRKFFLPSCTNLGFVNGAIHKAALSGSAPLRVVLAARRSLDPSILIPSLDFASSLREAWPHFCVAKLTGCTATLCSGLYKLTVCKRRGTNKPSVCYRLPPNGRPVTNRRFVVGLPPTGARVSRGLEREQTFDLLALAQSTGNNRAESADGVIGNLTLLGKSAPKTSQRALNSKLCPTGPDQFLFDFEKSARVITPEGGNRNVVPVTFASQKCGQFGLLWCNHFWQKESFQTMLHVAKINFCFSSTMCFYLAIESVLCEQNAREWRHKSIQRTCAFFDFECCTQGHTKSDRVETILFNIFRGTGIAGLQSLQWKKSFYSFACQRFYPRLTFSKLNWPQSTANKPTICKGYTNLGFVNGAALLKVPPAERSSVGPTSLELYKVRAFSKFCLVNVRTEPTFRLSMRCSYRPRRRLGLSTAPVSSFT